MTVHIATVALSLHLAAHSGTCVLLGLELFSLGPQGPTSATSKIVS